MTWASGNPDWRVDGSGIPQKSSDSTQPENSRGLAPASIKRKATVLELRNIVSRVHSGHTSATRQRRYENLIAALRFSHIGPWAMHVIQHLRKGDYDCDCDDWTLLSTYVYVVEQGDDEDHMEGDTGCLNREKLDVDPGAVRKVQCLKVI